ncbi:MAG TPA: hypothetical protein VFS21_23660 [Roseiflexaceae bacterium]|nr:hypothetical protein [Roseiflexaceae bacterium]
MSPEVEASFFLFVGGKKVAEGELLANTERYLDYIREEDEYEGGLELRAPAAPPIVVEDSLPAVVKNLCFLPVPDLAAGRGAVYHYHSQYGQIHLAPEGGALLLTGDGIEPARVERAALIRALHAAGVRFIQLLEQAQTVADSPKVASLIVFLNQQRAVADEALATLG